MKDRTFFWGILLISFGVLLLIQQFDICLTCSVQVPYIIACLLIVFGFYVIFQKKIVKLIFLSLFSLLLSFLIFKIFDFDRNHLCIKDKIEIYRTK
jgi:hypothetical protein